MSDVLEIASSGRAKCRGCGRSIEKGAWRFGERTENPFGEGEATYWFHPDCAAFRRPERFASLSAEQLQVLPEATELQKVAAQGIAHHRLPRITGVEHSKSGRAHCRHCKETIATGAWRIVLTIWEEARFTPMGFIHFTCAHDYFGTDELEPYLRRTEPPEEFWAEVKR